MLWLKTLFPPLQHQHGQVVALLGAADEAVDRGGHVCVKALGGSVPVISRELRLDALLLEQLPVALGGFRQSVRIQEEDSSRRLLPPPGLPVGPVDVPMGRFSRVFLSRRSCIWTYGKGHAVGGELSGCEL